MDHFADIRDKRMSELTDEQKDRAYEKWLRDQMGHNWPLNDVFEAMLRIIDRLRDEQPRIRIYDYVWPQRPEHRDDCVYACSYTPGLHLERGELLAVVHPRQLRNAYLQRADGSPADLLDAVPEQRVAPSFDPQHVYALERAVAGFRAVAARLGTKDDPYGGLMHADDADTLEELLNTMRPPLPLVERPKLCWDQPGYRYTKVGDKRTGEWKRIHVSFPFLDELPDNVDEYYLHVRQHLIDAGVPLKPGEVSSSMQVTTGKIEVHRDVTEVTYTWRNTNG